MTATWRRHFIICSGLGLLVVPVYFIDQALFARTGGSNWITLDFRGLFLWSYIIWLAIYIALSTMALLFFRAKQGFGFQVGLTALSVFILVTGSIIYGQARKWAETKQYRVLMERRRARFNVIELKSWQYYPDNTSPTEIRVTVAVHDSGRFAGNVTGEQSDSSGAVTTVFESIDDPSSQKQVNGSDVFVSVFPLKILHPTRADQVRIALYLFKDRTGPDDGDIAKVFMNSPQQVDDGQFFYGVLPSPENKTPAR